VYNDAVQKLINSNSGIIFFIVVVFYLLLLRFINSNFKIIQSILQNNEKIMFLTFIMLKKTILLQKPVNNHEEI